LNLIKRIRKIEKIFWPHGLIPNPWPFATQAETRWRTQLGHASGTLRNYTGQVRQHGNSLSRLSTRGGGTIEPSAAFFSAIGAPVVGKGVSDFLQHEGLWEMVRGSLEETHGGSRPVLTEAMKAIAMVTRGKVVSGCLPSLLLDKK
jgi:hypothetical protein